MIQKTTHRFVHILFLLSLSPNLSYSQELDYSEIFGTDWENALFFIGENSSWIKPALDKYNIRYAEAVAVVFPELIRYSALRDKIEISVLKTLYRNLGDDYADFSVGVFQIKPSFAEKIIMAAPAVMGKKPKDLFRKKNTFKNERDFRASIISDLENPRTELNYLIAFFKICYEYFNFNGEDGAKKIRFLATAYNTGFWKSREEIENMTEKKFFNTKLFKTENYSYADIALFWYENYSRKSENAELN
jgi:hypothetical protein